MISWSTIFIISVALSSSLTIADDPCRFVSRSKGIIDLTSLGRSDDKAAYPDAIPATGLGYKYSYNPCKPFTDGPYCTNVSVCQVSMDGQFIYALGTQESAQWSEGDSSDVPPSVSYYHGEKHVIVDLVCSTNGTNRFEALGEDPINVYRFRLTDKCACWNRCEVTPPPQRNCSINGTLYTSDKQIIESFPFHVSINPFRSLSVPPSSSYVIVDTDSHAVELNLVNIPTIPPALFCLSELRVLSIIDSDDLSISGEILRLASSLTSFTVSNISKSLVLPPELFHLPLLSTLSIVNCGLESLSEEIVRLEQLNQLILDQNELTTLPVTLGRMSSLKSLSVNNNPHLSSLDVLSGSTLLTTLRASNCVINRLPTNNYNLRTIEMNNNRLTSLDGIEAVTSDSCEMFLFQNNKITSISTNAFGNIQTLLYLDLSDNQLTILPDSVYRIRNLKMLDIHNNKFDEREREWIQGIFHVKNTTLIM